MMKRLPQGLLSRQARSPRTRRGVLLLVVLSMLVLFALIGVTFVLVASQSRRAIRAESREVIPYNNPQAICDDALKQLVRDTGSNRSALLNQSLLADLYGFAGAKGALNGAATAAAGGQFITLPVGTLIGNSVFYTGTSPTFTPNRFPTAAQLATPGFFNGCVLTVTSGPAADRSTRILGYSPTTNTITILAQDGISAASFPDGTETFLINGRPFSGAGFGFNHVTGQLNLNFQGATGANAYPFAMLGRPNFKLHSYGADGAQNTPDDLSFPLISPNEDYDAPDAQNWALAYIPLNPAPYLPVPPALPSPVPSPVPAADFKKLILPSFHRPDIVEFWNNKLTITDYEQLPLGLRRQLMLRPQGKMRNTTNPTDHANFTGGNPDFHPIVGPWDVDNDGDGIADSIWIDIGLPAQSAPDGRRYKPLVAILCQDLDGRLNVNAHGSIAQTQTLTYSGQFAGTAGVSSPPLSPGQGHGPADINLAALFPSVADYATLFHGNTTLGLAGRYGTSSTGTLGTGMPGFDNRNDEFSYLKQFEHSRSGMTFSSYMTPADLWARGVLGLDHRGQPLRYGVGPGTYPNDATDDPYELDLSQKALRGAGPLTGRDTPFSAAELERVLRRYDYDAIVLPSRLGRLLDPNSNSTIAHHRLVTTDSYDLPVPAFRPTRDMVLGPDKASDTGAAGDDGIGATLSTPATNLTMMDLLRYRLIKAGVTNTATINTVTAQLISPELVAGLRLDLNRPLGNGRDDNSNGVIDEVEEALIAAGEPLWDDVVNGPPPTGFANKVFWHNAYEIDSNKDGTVDQQDNKFDRQLLARHLYVLAMLLKDEATVLGTKEETARAIAQWAINVVDFRDADSVMTPFEFPLDPFTTNGWFVDNVIGATSTDDSDSNRGLVWGCERPELLITETFAFHDRRTEDLPDDNGTPAAKYGPGPMDDTDFDQRYVPQSGLVVELYNPWTATENLPGEYYYDSAAMTPWSTGIRLDKQTPASAGAQAPVWRLVIVSGANKQNDLNDPVVANRPVGADVERSVYFTNAAPATITTDTNQYYTSFAPLPILPGSYAVIGPAAPTTLQTGNVHHIVLGRNTSGAAYNGATDGTGTRRIDLDPTSATSGVISYNNTPTEEPASGSAKPAVAVVVNLPAGRTLSVSEPTAGYGSIYPISGTDPQEFAAKQDTPADTAPELKITGTTLAYKTLHLQRLANPLAPWNVDSNPYITIDTSPIDLTSFNGVSADPDPADTGNEANVMFATRQRGEQNDAANSANLWLREPFTKPDVPSPAMTGSNHFPQLLQHTLGFLNTPLGPAFPGMSAPAGYLGDPQNVPFPWLTWNNRPFANPGELMMVPRSRPSRLTADYSKVADAVGTTTDPFTNILGPYGHLPNFFHSNVTSGQSLHLYRLFDYVQVPSPFVGTEMELSPTTFAPTPLAYPITPGALTGFRAPFSRVMSYREPGRVNINTIPGDFGGALNPIWTGILNQPNAAMAIQWNTIDASRRGPNGSAAAFAIPFRTGGTVDQLPGLPPYTDVDMTMLRSSRPGALQTPVFNQPNPTLTKYNDTDRNPFFRYQLQQKLSGLLTTRSNVYAIWITVGNFEVSAAPVISPATTVDFNVYPDGLQLGAELGSDSGNVKRHRAFYIFDRSIPVGFEPGKDHNVENGVLLRRFIE